MKTRTFRVILVTASAALLTAMGLVGAGMASTASAAPQQVALAPAQVPESDAPSCMIESWLCNPQPGEPWPTPTPTPGPTAASPSSVQWTEIANVIEPLH
jgi:hypothetical protein